MSDPVYYHLGDFPPSHIEWERLVPLIGLASRALARYDGLLAGIPNAAVLLAPLAIQEAVLSSRIEGTAVTVGEVLEVEAAGDSADVTQPKFEEAKEVRNYHTALSFAANALAERPLSSNLLREAHMLLMKDVRGRDKNPGAFRDEQNWIGPEGCTIEQASFVPISQVQLLAGLDTWAGYMQSCEVLDPLVQLAIVHVEFEALHPFKDGNGRLGRMIIPLFLFERKILSAPTFYMSGYLEARREQYVETLRAVSRDGAWTDWCTFFLEGLIDQASENQTRAQAILDLHQEMPHALAALTHSQYSGRAVEFLFSFPIFNSTHFIESSGIPRSTALRILAILRREGLLRTIRKNAGRRPAVFAFRRLLNIAEGDDIF